MMSDNLGIGILGDKYYIISNKGGGGFSQVYLVRNINTQEEYAAKILKKDRSYQREVYINELIKKHQIPNVVNFIESGKALVAIEGEETKDSYYIILDYYPKGDLLKFIESSGGLPEKCCKIVYKKLLESIQKLHNIGIFHFDIKLQNILLDDDFNPKLGDFGISRLNVESTNGQYICNAGTTPFKAPQIFLGVPFNGVKADIFSLGATLFNLLLGSKLFKFRSYIDKSKATDKEKYDELCKDEFYSRILGNRIDEFWKAVEVNYNPVISQEFKNLIIRMVEFKECDRPNNIQEILDDVWFKEINNLSDEEEKKLKDEYKSEMKKKEGKMNDIFGSTENVKQRVNERVNESCCDISFRDDMIPKCVKEDLKFDNFIKIKGDLKPLSFMNKLLKKVAVLYDKVEIGEKEKNLKFKILFKVNQEVEDEDDEDDESIIILEKDLTILIELLKVNEKEYLLNFIKENGELSDFYYYVKKIMGYAKEYI